MDEDGFIYVDKQIDLEKLCDHLAGETEVALDSEADNLHHFETKLCLLQLRFDKTIYLLDVTADLDLERFWKILSGLHLIMHGSDFDLRLFEEFCQFEANSLFDSMLASQLLGIKRIGLAALLEENFGVKIPKDSQKSDWSQRPLTPKMLKYAATDVLYLHELRDKLMARIRELGRESWLEQRCNNQIRIAKSGFPRNDENSWRISRSDRLDERGQAAVYELWHWRQNLAKRLDRPPFKVLGNDYIIALAEGVSEGNWEFVFEGLPQGIQRRARQGLKDALKQGASRDVETLPQRPPRPERRAPLSQQELDRQDTVKAFRDKLSKELAIDPTLIATRSQVAQVARDPDDLSGFLPWQQELLGPCLEDLKAQP
ncbi:HRDC domain-containing protein [Pelagicoccus sp. NFK12]|uniref:HRDC domain-containing protein n=1 Tax=Pelagicoccus enzymogenes TaxID=2773457 RepID=A0A927FAF6_9BACT|nr:ribonuclease D [Pelagicoccus enzymogenes]MBD5780790.1 HRDC domain-containing protein [Pelagicoccus enzymogenes]